MRHVIVEEARDALGEDSDTPDVELDSDVYPIPESQTEYYVQADAVLRDLFPRMPNDARSGILERSFDKSKKARRQPPCSFVSVGFLLTTWLQDQLQDGKLPVGLADNIPLSRRVHLATLAHIRHTYTRYDELLREMSWQSARRATAPICIKYLVSWRSDDENGRELLDEILREVVVISDSEDDGEDDEDDDDSEDDEDEDDDDVQVTGERCFTYSCPPHEANIGARAAFTTRRHPPGTPAKKAQRGFGRYKEALYKEAIDRAYEEAREELRRTGGVQSSAQPLARDGVFDHGHMDSLPLRSTTPQMGGRIITTGVDPSRRLPARESSHSDHRYRAPGETRVAPAYPLSAPFRPRQDVAEASLMYRTSSSGRHISVEQSHVNGRQQARAQSPVSMHHDSLQDYLIPSIEPASPDTGSSTPRFIRSVPANGQIPVVTTREPLRRRVAPHVPADLMEPDSSYRQVPMAGVRSEPSQFFPASDLTVNRPVRFSPEARPAPIVARREPGRHLLSIREGNTESQSVHSTVTTSQRPVAVTSQPSASYHHARPSSSDIEYLGVRPVSYGYGGRGESVVVKRELVPVSGSGAPALSHGGGQYPPIASRPEHSVYGTHSDYPPWCQHRVSQPVRTHSPLVGHGRHHDQAFYVGQARPAETHNVPVYRVSAMPENQRPYLGYPDDE